MLKKRTFRFLYTVFICLPITFSIPRLGLAQEKNYIQRATLTLGKAPPRATASEIIISQELKNVSEKIGKNIAYRFQSDLGDKNAQKPDLSIYHYESLSPRAKDVQDQILIEKYGTMWDDLDKDSCVAYNRILAHQGEVSELELQSRISTKISKFMKDQSIAYKNPTTLKEFMIDKTTGLFTAGMMAYDEEAGGVVDRYKDPRVGMTTAIISTAASAGVASSEINEVLGVIVEKVSDEASGKFGEYLDTKSSDEKKEIHYKKAAQRFQNVAIFADSKADQITKHTMHVSSEQNLAEAERVFKKKVKQIAYETTLNQMSNQGTFVPQHARTSAPNYVKTDSISQPKTQAVYNVINEERASEIIKKYKSIPGGVTLEGEGIGLGHIKSAYYDSQKHCFVINNSVFYDCTVSRQNLIDIFTAIHKDIKMGVSLGSVELIYGALREESKVVLNLKLADDFLGDIVFASVNNLIKGYNFPEGYIPKKNTGTGGYCAVYFNFSNFRFKILNKQCYLIDSNLNITLVPLTNKKGEDGGLLPDYNAINRGKISDEYKANIEHITQNIDYYMKERLLRIVKKYGETAAFARALIKNGIDLTIIISQM